MRVDLKYPSIKSVDSVLSKIGVDPKARYDELDQDYQYTTCRLEELSKYIELYAKVDTTDMERRLLGCYFLECLNEHIAVHGAPYKEQDQVIDCLLKDIEIHESEIEYWADTSDSNENNRWWITKYIIERQA